LKSKILITGANGFVGKNLVNRLKEKEELLVSLEGERIDVLNWNHLDRIGKVDAIIHLAARTSIPESITTPYDTYYSNMVGTLNILELAKKNNIKRIINISTYVYGTPSYLPIDEKHPIKPHSPYNKSKLSSEVLCEYYSNDYEIDIVTLRPFYIYGPMSNPNFFIASAIRQIKQNKKVFLSKRNTKRDFLFIDDFIDLLIRVWENFPKGYDVFNVGYGQSHTLEETIGIMKKLTGIDIKIEYKESERGQDVLEMIANIEKAKTFFGWMPKIDLYEGIKRTISFYDLGIE
jgi:UDP-glucose 4-epimerase